MSMHPGFAHNVFMWCSHCIDKGIKSGIDCNEAKLKAKTIMYDSDTGPPKNMYCHCYVQKTDKRSISEIISFTMVCEQCFQDKSKCKECDSPNTYNVQIKSVEEIRTDMKKIKIDVLDVAKASLEAQIAEIDAEKAKLS